MKRDKFIPVDIVYAPEWGMLGFASKSEGKDEVISYIFPRFLWTEEYKGRYKDTEGSSESYYTVIHANTDEFDIVGSTQLQIETESPRILDENRGRGKIQKWIFSDAPRNINFSVLVSDANGTSVVLDIESKRDVYRLIRGDIL